MFLVYVVVSKDNAIICFLSFLYYSTLFCFFNSFKYLYFLFCNSSVFLRIHKFAHMQKQKKGENLI